METLHEFRLGFVTDLNQVGKITVPRANPDLLPAQIATAMQAMVTSGVLQWTAGDASSLHSADLVTTERREITIAS
jgi:hypothetical protein